MKVQPTYTEAGRRRLLDRVGEAAKPDAALLAQVAWAYHRADRPVDRDDFLQRALAADPRQPAAHFLLAERAVRSNRFEDARREYETGFAAGGEEFYALMQYTRLLAREGGLLDEEPPHGHPAPKPAFDDAQKALAERLLELLERAKRCFPRYVRDESPYFLRARLLERLGRGSESLAELRAYCAINDSDGGARRILVKKALERNDFEEADKYLIELRTIDPFDRHLWRDLARCEKELQRPADAIRMLSLALVIDPSTEAAYDPTRPRDDLQADDAATRAQLLFDLADLYLLVGERARAQRSLDEARKLAPDDERAADLARRLESSGG
jgi:tetratricopeptide (TPR) repeat protein